MKIKEKNNRVSKNTNIGDKQISQDFSEIFDKSENNEDIGSTFIDARVKKGLTQEDVSKILKVRVSAIKQIENGEQLQSLGSAYSLGFIRSYAKLVDLEPDNIVENYKLSNNKNVTKLDYNFPGVIEEKRSLIPMTVLFTFLFSLVVYSSWYYLNINDLETTKENITYLDKENNNLEYVKVENKKNNLSDKTDKINSKKTISDEKKTSKNITSEKSNTVNSKIIENNNNKIVSTDSLVLDVSKEISNTNETSAIANERIPKEEMVLKSSGNSWVEIEDIDGNSYLTRLMRSGETFVIPNKKGLTLSTGNAGVLSLTFGSIHISKLGSIGEVISSRPLNIEAFKER